APAALACGGGGPSRLQSLRAGLALARAQNDVAAARGQVEAARAELNALLAYPNGTAPSLGDPLEAGPMPAAQDVTQQALAGNAELRVLDRRIEEARARVAPAHAPRHPHPPITGALTHPAPRHAT